MHFSIEETVALRGLIAANIPAAALAHNVGRIKSLPFCTALASQLIISFVYSRDVLTLDRLPIYNASCSTLYNLPREMRK